MTDEDSLSGFDLTRLPTGEDEEFEFKCSRMSPNQAKEEIQKAASAFGNSGGGYLVWGVNDQGDADGGVLPQVGNQAIRDWADQAIHRVEPSPEYDIKLIDNATGRGTIDQGRVVLVVRIEQSYIGPHQAPDHRYYIRAGAHTVPARRFLVEAIWAKRHFAKPKVTHSFREKPGFWGDYSTWLRGAEGCTCRRRPDGGIAIGRPVA